MPSFRCFGSPDTNTALTAHSMMFTFNSELGNGGETFSDRELTSPLNLATAAMAR